MKKTLAFMILGLFMISMIGVVSADDPCDFTCEGCCAIGTTTIGGTIYQEDLGVEGGPIAGASVMVICERGEGGTEYSRPTTSLDDGGYAVVFPQNQCTIGDKIIVSAEKPSDELSGEEEGEVTINVFEWGCFRLDVGIVNVGMVPEFGFFMGALTLLCAVGIFAFVKRE